MYPSRVINIQMAFGNKSYIILARNYQEPALLKVEVKHPLPFKLICSVLVIIKLLKLDHHIDLQPRLIFKWRQAKYPFITKSA